MQLLKLLLIAIAVALPTADATCFKTGQTWGSSANRQRASVALNDVCGQLAVSYPSGRLETAHLLNASSLRW